MCHLYHSLSSSSIQPIPPEMQHHPTLCTHSRAAPTPHLARCNPGDASTARQLPKHCTYHSGPCTEVRLDAFGGLFGPALDKLLDRFITHIPLKSVALQLTLNTEYSLNKNPLFGCRPGSKAVPTVQSRTSQQQ